MLVVIAKLLSEKVYSALIFGIFVHSYTQRDYVTVLKMNVNKRDGGNLLAV